MEGRCDSLPIFLKSIPSFQRAFEDIVLSVEQALSHLTHLEQSFCEFQETFPFIWDVSSGGEKKYDSSLHTTAKDRTTQLHQLLLPKFLQELIFVSGALTRLEAELEKYFMYHHTALCRDDSEKRRKENQQEILLNQQETNAKEHFQRCDALLSSLVDLDTHLAKLEEQKLDPSVGNSPTIRVIVQRLIQDSLISVRQMFLFVGSLWVFSVSPDPSRNEITAFLPLFFEKMSFLKTSKKLNQLPGVLGSVDFLTIFLKRTMKYPILVSASLQWPSKIGIPDQQSPSPSPPFDPNPPKKFFQQSRPLNCENWPLSSTLFIKGYHVHSLLRGGRLRVLYGALSQSTSSPTQGHVLGAAASLSALQAPLQTKERLLSFLLKLSSTQSKQSAEVGSGPITPFEEPGLWGLLHLRVHEAVQLKALTKALKVGPLQFRNLLNQIYWEDAHLIDELCPQYSPGWTEFLQRFGSIAISPGDLVSEALTPLLQFSDQLQLKDCLVKDSIPSAPSNQIIPITVTSLGRSLLFMCQELARQCSVAVAPFFFLSFNERFFRLQLQLQESFSSSHPISFSPLSASLFLLTLTFPMLDPKCLSPTVLVEGVLTFLGLPVVGDPLEYAESRSQEPQSHREEHFREWIKNWVELVKTVPCNQDILSLLLSCFLEAAVRFGCQLCELGHPHWGNFVYSEVFSALQVCNSFGSLPSSGSFVTPTQITSLQKKCEQLLLLMYPYLFPSNGEKEGDSTVKKLPLVEIGWVCEQKIPIGATLPVSSSICLRSFQSILQIDSHGPLSLAPANPDILSDDQSGDLLESKIESYQQGPFEGLRSWVFVVETAIDTMKQCEQDLLKYHGQLHDRIQTLDLHFGNGNPQEGVAVIMKDLLSSYNRDIGSLLQKEHSALRDFAIGSSVFAEMVAHLQSPNSCLPLSESCRLEESLFKGLLTILRRIAAGAPKINWSDCLCGTLERVLSFSMGDPLAFFKESFFFSHPSPSGSLNFFEEAAKKIVDMVSFMGARIMSQPQHLWSMLERAIENQGKPIESQDELGSFERELKFFLLQIPRPVLSSPNPQKQDINSVFGDSISGVTPNSPKQNGRDEEEEKETEKEKETINSFTTGEFSRALHFVTTSLFGERVSLSEACSCGALHSSNTCHLCTPKHEIFKRLMLSFDLTMLTSLLPTTQPSSLLDVPPCLKEPKTPLQRTNSLQPALLLLEGGVLRALAFHDDLRQFVLPFLKEASRLPEFIPSLLHHFFSAPSPLAPLPQVQSGNGSKGPEPPRRRRVPSAQLQDRTFCCECIMYTELSQLPLDQAFVWLQSLQGFFMQEIEATSFVGCGFCQQTLNQRDLILSITRQLARCKSIQDELLFEFKTVALLPFEQVPISQSFEKRSCNSLTPVWSRFVDVLGLPSTPSSLMFQVTSKVGEDLCFGLAEDQQEFGALIIWTIIHDLLLPCQIGDVSKTVGILLQKLGRLQSHPHCFLVRLLRWSLRSYHSSIGATFVRSVRWIAAPISSKDHERIRADASKEGAEWLLLVFELLSFDVDSLPLELRCFAADFFAFCSACAQHPIKKKQGDEKGTLDHETTHDEKYESMWCVHRVFAEIFDGFTLVSIFAYVPFWVRNRGHNEKYGLSLPPLCARRYTSQIWMAHVSILRNIAMGVMGESCCSGPGTCQSPVSAAELCGREVVNSLYFLLGVPSCSFVPVGYPRSFHNQFPPSSNHHTLGFTSDMLVCTGPVKRGEENISKCPDSPQLVLFAVLSCLIPLAESLVSWARYSHHFAETPIFCELLCHVIALQLDSPLTQIQEQEQMGEYMHHYIRKTASNSNLYHLLLFSALHLFSERFLCSKDLLIDVDHWDEEEDHRKEGESLQNRKREDSSQSSKVRYYFLCRLVEFCLRQLVEFFFLKSHKNESELPSPSPEAADVQQESSPKSPPDLFPRFQIPHLPLRSLLSWEESVDLSILTKSPLSLYFLVTQRYDQIWEGSSRQRDLSLQFMPAIVSEREDDQHEVGVQFSGENITTFPAPLFRIHVMQEEGQQSESQKQGISKSIKLFGVTAEERMSLIEKLVKSLVNLNNISGKGKGSKGSRPVLWLPSWMILVQLTAWELHYAPKVSDFLKKRRSRPPPKPHEELEELEKQQGFLEARLCSLVPQILTLLVSVCPPQTQAPLQRSTPTKQKGKGTPPRARRHEDPLLMSVSLFCLLGYVYLWKLASGSFWSRKFPTPPFLLVSGSLSVLEKQPECASFELFFKQLKNLLRQKSEPLPPWPHIQAKIVSCLLSERDQFLSLLLGNSPQEHH